MRTIAVTFISTLIVTFAGAGAGCGPSKEEQELFSALNTTRAEFGLPPFTLDSALGCAASRHAVDIGTAQECTHTGSDGSSHGSRAKDCGGQANAEIVACGHPNAASAVRGWLSSTQGHREAVLRPGQVTIGLAMHKNFWVVVLK